MQTHLDTTNITKTQLTGLLTILEEVPDPRVTATVDHDLPDILTIALCTILCGGDLRAKLAGLDPVLHRRFLGLRVVAFGLRRGFPKTRTSCFCCSLFALGLLAFVHVRFSCSASLPTCPSNRLKPKT